MTTLLEHHRSSSIETCRVRIYKQLGTSPASLIIVEIRQNNLLRPKNAWGRSIRPKRHHTAMVKPGIYPTITIRDIMGGTSLGFFP